MSERDGAVICLPTDRRAGKLRISRIVVGGRHEKRMRRDTEGAAWMLRRHCVEPTPNQEPSHARDVRRFGRRVGDEYGPLHRDHGGRGWILFRRRCEAGDGERGRAHGEYVRARDHAPPDAGRGSLIDYRHSGNRGDLRSRRWLGEWSWS